MFKRINEAKQILCNPNDRNKYDKVLEDAERRAERYMSEGKDPRHAYDRLRKDIDTILEEFIKSSIRHAEQVPPEVTAIAAGGGAVVGIIKAAQNCPKDASFGEVLLRLGVGALAGGAMGAAAPSAALAYDELESDDKEAILQHLGFSSDHSDQ